MKKVTQLSKDLQMLGLWAQKTKFHDFYTRHACYCLKIKKTFRGRALKLYVIVMKTLRNFGNK